MQQVPVFVINLRSRTERREMMEQAQRRLGVEFTFVPAIDGRDPQALVDTGMPTGRLTGRPRSRIDYAVVSSHRLCWKRIIEGDASCGIILEDDVVLADDFAVFTRQDWIPSDVDVVKLETILGYVELHSLKWNEAIRRKIGKLESLHLGAAGYLVTKQAASRLWEATKVPFDPVDHILFTKEVWKEVDLNVVQVDPAPVVQGMYHISHAASNWASSSIQDDRDSRGITMNIEAHRQAGGDGGITVKKVLRMKTATHAARLLRSLLNRGAYKRVQFG